MPFPATISSETTIAKLEKRDTYHAKETEKSLHVCVEHAQVARDVGILIRQIRDADKVFMGCNIQNPYAGVCVEENRDGLFTEWTADMFCGKWVEPLHTAAITQLPWGALAAEQIGKMDWMK